MKVAELCRKHGMPAATLYQEKSWTGGLQVSESGRQNALETESPALKWLLTDAMIDPAGFEGLLPDCRENARAAEGRDPLANGHRRRHVHRCRGHE